MKCRSRSPAARSDRAQPCYVIAEAGVNHNCDVQLGYKLVETAGAAGADAIKFQSYTAGKIATRVAPRYWVEPADPHGTQWDTFDKLDKLSDRDFKSLLGHAQHVGLTAFSTPFDDEAVDLLASLDVPAFKIASADLTCHGLIERAARVGKPMLLSTGTATLGEVEEALEVCRRAGNEQVAILHCTLKYPCPPEGINLRMMEHLMRAFPEVPVGLSDHSLGISVPQAAVALGACVVEKHYTVDKTLPRLRRPSPLRRSPGDEGDGGGHPHGREGAGQGGEGRRAARGRRPSLRAPQRDLEGAPSRAGRPSRARC